ncbi:MAG: sugar transferase [Candidatus Omnitrophica bacterium]|nr:sugar transferase [Candidatus Omnitrophota bacterium]
MSFPESIAAEPLGLVALWVGISGAIVQFAQSKFVKLKRIFDIVVSLSALALTFPVVLACAIFIKIFSPKGHIFYTQNRVGKDGKIFKIFKLRSMIPDAEKSSGAVWSNEEADPRIIPFVGTFLRKTHIDEVPQFLNVLFGDMSVVGPRPERPEIVKVLMVKIPEYEKRLNVKPGITGLAQIRHRYDKTLLDVKKKVKLDLLYIRRMCLFGELSILLRTLIVVFRGKALS